MIDQLKKIDEVTVSKGVGGENEPRTIQCETCAVSKMHRVINKAPSGCAIKPYQVLYFDLTINDKGFDGTSCIAHFTDEFTSYLSVYPLNDHKEKTLLPIFKSLINQCERAGISVNSMVTTIRTGQEISIGKAPEVWISQ